MFNYMPSDIITKIFLFYRSDDSMDIIESQWWNNLTLYVYIYTSLSLSSIKISVFKCCYYLEKKIVFNYLTTRLLMSLLQFTFFYRSDDSSNESTVEPEDENLLLYVYIYIYIYITLSLSQNK